MTCPLCQGPMHRPKDLSVHECKDCKARFFILITTRPQKTNEKIDKQIEV